MRRLTARATVMLGLLAMACLPSAAQQQPAPSATDPPAKSDTQSNRPQSSQQPWWLRLPDAPAPPPAPPPEKVFVMEGTQLNVVLDTPLSTRMTKKGESVTFLLSEPLDVGDGLELPPDTRVTGTVTEAKRPGIFGRAGELRLQIDQIEFLTGGGASLEARLESADPAIRMKADGSKGANLYSLASWTLQGTLLGSAIKGGKGAAYGAGAGAAAALIIMMSRRGPDLYLEPGTPFVVMVDSPVELRGWDVQQAQNQYRAGQPAKSDTDSTEEWSAEDDTEMRTNRPKLKRRPKTP